MNRLRDNPHPFYNFQFSHIIETGNEEAIGSLKTDAPSPSTTFAKIQMTTVRTQFISLRMMWYVCRAGILATCRDSGNVR